MLFQETSQVRVKSVKNKKKPGIWRRVKDLFGGCIGRSSTDGTVDEMDDDSYVV